MTRWHRNLSLTFTAVVAAKSWIALAMAEQTLSVARTSIGTVLRHVLGDTSLKGDLLFIAIVVVQRNEPVAGLHVSGHISTNRRLLHSQKYDKFLIILD